MKNELSVFVPSHITGFFEIIQNSNPLLKGSKGAGITLDEGVVTNTKIKDGNGNIIINVNNKEDSLNTISKKTVKIILDRYNVNIQDYDIYINHDSKLPIGAGFGTSARAITNHLNVYPDFEFATAEATCSAAEKGLRVLVFTVGKMTNRVTSRLEDKGIIYCIEDVKKV